MKFRRHDRGVEALATVPWFSELQPAELRRAARHADWVDVDVGTRLQQQGVRPQWLWVPVNGALQLEKDGCVVGHVHPGGAWGEAELLLGFPATADVVAPAALTVISLPGRAFHAMLADATFATNVARHQATASLQPQPVRRLSLLS